MGRLIFTILFVFNISHATFTDSVSIKQNGNDIDATNPIGIRLSDGTGYLTTLPVSLSSSPLASGASTSALQTTGNSYLLSLDNKLPANLTVSGGRLLVDVPAGASGLTDAELRFSPVPVSLNSTTISNFPATQAISAASLPLPTGAATSALQSAGNASAASIDTKLPSGLSVSSSRLLVDIPDPVNAPGYPSSTSGVFTADGQSIELNVKGQSAVVVDVSGTFVGSVTIFGSVDGVIFNIPVTGSNLGMPDDINSTITTEAAFRFNTAGFSHVRASALVTSGTINVKMSSGSGTSIVDANSGYLYTRTQLRDADGILLTGTTQGIKQSLDVNLTNPSVPVTGTFFQATQPISASSLPLPSGASTSALQSTGNTSVASIDTKTPALGQALDAASTPVVLPAAQISTLTPLSSVGVNNFPATQAVTGTFFQATQPVSIATAPVSRATNPTGTAVNIPQTGMDTGNSSTANLGIGATFTGTFKDVSEYSNLSAFVFSDQVSATDGLIIEYSTNGTTAVDSDTYTIPASNGQQLSFPLPTQFYRIRYVNGGVATTNLTIQAKLHSLRPKPSSHKLSQLVSDESDAEVVKAYQQHDIGRNLTNYFMNIPVIAPSAEALQSLTGYKSGAAVVATTTPAVVTTGKRYRITSINVTYVGIATAGSAKVTLRANTAGVVAIGSPAVASIIINAPAAVAGVGSSYNIPIGNGIEFAAGTGIGISTQGLSAVQAAAATGYVQVSILGYEY